MVAGDNDNGLLTLSGIVVVSLFIGAGIGMLLKTGTDEKVTAKPTVHTSNAFTDCFDKPVGNTGLSLSRILGQLEADGYAEYLTSPSRDIIKKKASDCTKKLFPAP